MVKIGRYRISFRRTFWMQTRVPTTARRYLFFWVFREARPTDVDEKKMFPIGTPMDYEGRRYLYWGAESEVPPGQVVWLKGEPLDPPPADSEGQNAWEKNA